MSSATAQRIDIEHVFYNAHSKVSHYVLRHTSHRLRSLVEHAVLGLAVCSFCVVILSHRTFVHREDIASISRGGYDGYTGYGGGVYSGGYSGGVGELNRYNDATCTAATTTGAVDDIDGDDYNDNTLSSNNEGGGGGGGDGGGYGLLGSMIGEGRGVSMYSIMVQLVRTGYAWMVSSSSNSDLHYCQNSNSTSSSSSSSSSSWLSEGKKIPGHCLKSIPGFREDADVNHMLLRYEDNNNNNDNKNNNNSQDEDSNVQTIGSRAFTIYRGHQEHETIVTGMPMPTSSSSSSSSTSVNNNNNTQQSHSCVIRGISSPSESTSRHRTSLFGFAAAKDQIQNNHHGEGECSSEISSFLANRGYLLPDQIRHHQSSYNNNNSKQQKPALNEHHHYHHRHQQQHQQQENQQYSSIIYSYSHSQGFLRLHPPQPLQHLHNISTQFIIASTTDPNCFGEPFAQSIIFRLPGLGPDTVILNWILGLQTETGHHQQQHRHQQQHQQQHDDGGGDAMTLSRDRRRTTPRFVYHWKTKKELDLDGFDMDHYAFSSKSRTREGGGGDNYYYGSSGSGSSSTSGTPTASLSSSPMMLLPTTLASNLHQILLSKIQKYPITYHFLRFLSFKCLVLLSTLLIFFLTTSLVSFTFQETQDRMLEFTLQLQTRVRARMPLGGLILGHVLENLVFVPIMVGMIFFLIEFYEDKFLAFMVLSMVWVCEVFSAVSIRSAQGMHFFPRVFFLYFTLFHVYFFSCPIGFTYASLASTILFLFHTMLFFWNRYELPALHSGLISSQTPRMARLGEDSRGRESRGGEVSNDIISPPRIQPSRSIPRLHHDHPPPRIPQFSSSDDRSNFTLPTAPLSSTIDFTPQSDQPTLLQPSYHNHGPMRSYIAAASTSLQSIRSLASIQSSSSLVAAERTTSPNFIFQGGYNFNDSGGAVGDGEEDSYIARVMSNRGDFAS